MNVSVQLFPVEPSSASGALADGNQGDAGSGEQHDGHSVRGDGSTGGSGLSGAVSSSIGSASTGGGHSHGRGGKGSAGVVTLSVRSENLGADGASETLLEGVGGSQGAIVVSLGGLGILGGSQGDVLNGGVVVGHDVVLTRVRPVNVNVATLPETVPVAPYWSTAIAELAAKPKPNTAAMVARIATIFFFMIVIPL